MSAFGRTGAPLFGLFAEGSSYTHRNRLPFEELWKALTSRCAPLGAVKVYGFDKSQIVNMRPPPGIKPAREPLDIFIDRAHRIDGFQNVIIAFDAFPENEHIKPSCLRTEVNFVLEALSASKVLDNRFRQEAARLIKHYAQNKGIPRPKGRPPRGPLDIIYMDPMFEALLASDEQTVLHGLGLDRRPKDWPKFKTNSKQTDRHVISQAVEVANPNVKRKIGGNFDSRKAEWAFHIISQAGANARIWRHAIPERLCILTGA